MDPFHKQNIPVPRAIADIALEISREWKKPYRTQIAFDPRVIRRQTTSADGTVAAIWLAVDRYQVIAPAAFAGATVRRTARGWTVHTDEPLCGPFVTLAAALDALAGR